MERESAKRLTIPKGFGSSHERGMRWFSIWNLKKKKKDFPQILCKCAALLTVRPLRNGNLNFSHKCGFEADLTLENY